ncbi:MAG TPA: hypothetical protein VI322_00790 [Candidatus Saccharimonadia bacterium]
MPFDHRHPAGALRTTALWWSTGRPTDHYQLEMTHELLLAIAAHTDPTGHFNTGLAELTALVCCEKPHPAVENLMDEIPGLREAVAEAKLAGDTYPDWRPSRGVGHMAESVRHWPSEAVS